MIVCHNQGDHKGRPYKNVDVAAARPTSKSCTTGYKKTESYWSFDVARTKEVRIRCIGLEE